MAGEHELSPERFGAAFKAFMEAVLREAVVERTEGARPAFIKELLRRAALLAAAGAPAVANAQIEASLAELGEGGRLGRSILGMRSRGEDEERTEAAGGGTVAGLPGFPGFPVEGRWVGRGGGD